MRAVEGTSSRPVGIKVPLSTEPTSSSFFAALKFSFCAYL